MIATFRRVLAFPFYLVAFVLHLLCAAFTVIAQKIAGDDAGPPRRIEALALAAFCCGILASLPFLIANDEKLTPDITKLLIPQMPIPGWRNIKTGFTKDQTWAPGLIRLNACIFAQRAIRHLVEPSVMQFAPCGDGGSIQTTMDSDFYEVTVNGVVNIDDTPTGFTVTLNHYPPAVTEWGYITTGINIDHRAPPRISCALP